MANMSFPCISEMDVDLNQVEQTDLITQNEQDSELGERLTSQLQSLRKAEKEIKDLKAKLSLMRSKTRKERKELEKEARKHRSASAPIRRVPAEILITIFEEAVKTRPTRIRSLLLVCRHFNTIIMNCPILWTNLPLVFNKNNLSAYKSLYKYSKACCERSQGLLLQLTLNFKRFPDRLSFIENRLGRVYPEGEENEDLVHEFRSSIQCAQYERLFKKCLQIVRFLTSHMQRWGSLTVILGSRHRRGFLPVLMPILHGEAPNLHTLVTERCRSGEKSFILYESPLTKLVTANARYTDGLKFPELLQILEIRVRQVSDLDHLSLLNNLQRLTVDLFHLDDDEVTLQENPSIRLPKITLPHLNSLSLLGPVPVALIDALEVPLVRQLRLVWRNSQDFTRLPNVDPLDLCWEVLIQEATKPSYLPEIEVLFEHYPKLQTATMRKHHMMDALTALADAREQRRLMELRSITFIDGLEWEDDWEVLELREQPDDDDILVVDTGFGRTREELLAEVVEEGDNDDSLSSTSDYDSDSTNTSFTTTGSSSSDGEDSDSDSD